MVVDISDADIIFAFRVQTLSGDLEFLLQKSIIPLLPFLIWSFLYSFLVGFASSESDALFILTFKIDVVVKPEYILLQTVEFGSVPNHKLRVILCWYVGSLIIHHLVLVLKNQELSSSLVSIFIYPTQLALTFHEYLHLTPLVILSIRTHISGHSFSSSVRTCTSRHLLFFFMCILHMIPDF